MIFRLFSKLLLKSMNVNGVEHLISVPHIQNRRFRETDNVTKLDTEDEIATRKLNISSYLYQIAVNIDNINVLLKFLDILFNEIENVSDFNSIEDVIIPPNMDFQAIINKILQIINLNIKDEKKKSKLLQFFKWLLRLFLEDEQLR